MSSQKITKQQAVFYQNIGIIRASGVVMPNLMLGNIQKNQDIC